MLSFVRIYQSTYNSWHIAYLPVILQRASATRHYRLELSDILTVQRLRHVSTYQLPLMASDYGSRKAEEQEQSKHGVQVNPVVQDTPTPVFEEGSLDPVYEAKARVLNKAIQDIGMGKYQWQVRPFSLAT